MLRAPCGLVPQPKASCTPDETWGGETRSCVLLTRVCACVCGFVVTVLVLDAFVAIEVRVTARARVPGESKSDSSPSRTVCVSLFYVTRGLPAVSSESEESGRARARTRP